MSLSRAFTTRRAKQSIDLKESNFPHRSNTSAKGHGYSGSIRHKISAPMELTHTTNMLAYNAPDLYPRSASSTTSSKASDDESDGNQTSASSPPTSPDVASVDDRSVSPSNHLSCYFTAPGQKLSSPSEAPTIPQRAPSHTKKASYDNLARQQSTRQFSHNGKSLSAKSSLSSFSVSRSSSTSTTATSLSSGSFSRGKAPVPSVPEVPSQPEAQVIVSPPARQPSQKKLDMSPAHHPFGSELAQVSEIAEDYGVKDKFQIIDDEEQELLGKGLCRFRAEDYLADVSDLFASFFKSETTQAQPVWI
jgi:hypothetical protein